MNHSYVLSPRVVKKGVVTSLYCVVDCVRAGCDHVRARRLEWAQLAMATVISSLFSWWRSSPLCGAVTRRERDRGIINNQARLHVTRAK